MKFFSHPTNPPISRRISAWWQGYDLAIPAHGTQNRRSLTQAERAAPTLLNNRFDVDTDMSNLLFGDGATGPVNRAFVVPIVLPWLKAGVGRLHMVGHDADWALDLAHQIKRPAEFITDSKRNVDLAHLRREQMPHPAPAISIRTSDRALTVTPSAHMPSTLTMICVDVGGSRTLTDHAGAFVRKVMQRGDEVLILQMRDSDDRMSHDELPATVGRRGLLEDLPGLEVLERRTVSDALMNAIRVNFANWRQACDLASNYRSADEMNKALIRLAYDWHHVYRRLDQGLSKYVAIRARKTIMSGPELV